MIRYLQIFFKEKQLPEANWELKDKQGVTHWIGSEVVLEHIAIAPRHEQEAIAKVIRQIDAMNGDVNDYLKHLAEALIND